MAFQLSSLNPQQREAVVTIRGPVLILAGAGTGKTRTLTCRIAHMVRKEVAPGQILAVTFTNKAAKEMLSRVQAMLPRERGRTGEKPERPTICTFHSLCVRILRQHIEKLGYKRNFVIYDTSDQVATVRRLLNQISDQGSKVDPGAALSMMSRIRNAGGRVPIDTDPNLQALAEMLLRSYSSALRAANAVDFDDLILLTLQLFEEHPDALEACRERWPYVLVDEYQDTNGTQFSLVHHLTRVSRNLCVVGDDDQSIYGWRGAEIANILDLEKHFPEVKIIKLEQNYRSTPIILRAANAVIQVNPRRRQKTLWSDKPEGDKIQIYNFATDEEEARSVVDNIEYDRIARKIPWNHHAILFRTNLQSRPLETALRKARVRYHLIGGQSFFDRREIRDFLAYLKVFVNPEDDISLLRIANTPSRGISDVTRERLLAASAQRQVPVFAVMRHTDVLESLQPRTRSAIQNFVAWIDQQREPILANKPLSLRSWAENWLAETGYLEDLRRTEKDPETAENRIKNLRELVLDLDEGDSEEIPLAAIWEKPAEQDPDAPLPDSSIQTETHQPIQSAPSPSDEDRPFRPPIVSPHPKDRLDSFLADLTLDRERDDDESPQGEVVTLITVHAAKGLEFPHVHLVGVEDGLLPHTRSKIEGNLDEERRLFYVAMTRAQESLRISFCSGRRRYGQVLPCHPSPFLADLPKDCIEEADATSSKPVQAEAGDDFFAAMRAAIED